jgi:hypothetical protein
MKTAFYIIVAFNTIFFSCKKELNEKVTVIKIVQERICAGMELIIKFVTWRNCLPFKMGQTFQHPLNS